MYAVRIRVDRVIDFGSIVSLIGTDLETENPVAIHVDLRAGAELDEAMPEAGLEPPVAYDAGGCTLTLNLVPADPEARHG